MTDDELEARLDRTHYLGQAVAHEMGAARLLAHAGEAFQVGADDRAKLLREEAKWFDERAKALRAEWESKK